VVTALVVVAAVLGPVAGHLLNRAAGRFPWPDRRRGGATPTTGGLPAPQPHDRGVVAMRGSAVELVTAVLFVLVALRFGASWELPAFLFLAGAAVLLAVIDVQHHLLPNRVVVPSAAIGAGMLLLAAVPGQEWATLLRAVLGAVVLFAVLLVLALLSPRSLGMGDVKLSGLLGLYLGWVGWGALVVGAAAGFVIQALLALVLLAGRRIGLRGELPFGPAMLAGAALAIGWSEALLR
jgi:leader peptidase (prepilin peptidase) / N-methyltransferase